MCVGFLYTLTCMRPCTRVIVVSQKENPLSSLVNCMLRVNRIQMIMKFLYVILLKTRMAVVHVSVPPAWRMNSGGNCAFFYVLHHQVSGSGTHGRPHGTAERLLVMNHFVSKEAVFQDKL